jgi:protoporphyrinogen oxidase
MEWWMNILPLQTAPSRDDLLLQRDVPLAAGSVLRPLRSGKTEACPSADPEKTNLVMLIRQRLSRIFFLRKFFNYPISLTPETVINLGPTRIMRIGLSYMRASLFPIREERSLEDFFINRFGRELYETFFKDYTEKVWGVPCNQIKPEWGAQRIKGLSVTKTIAHAVKKLFSRNSSIGQKNVETTLIEQFMYPKLGPGQLWEEVADQVVAAGGELHLNHTVVALTIHEEQITEVTVRNEATGEQFTVQGDYFFSSMPVKELIAAIGTAAPQPVRSVAANLQYRDFMTVGLLAKKLLIRNKTTQKTVNDIVPDNWIYIQERDVRLGRLQIFNNWSPYLVSDSDTVWVGLEYFCTEGDDLWTMPDGEFCSFAASELAQIDIIDPADILDSVVLRVPKAYPAYFGAYEQFSEVREYTDTIANLYLVGRNGMHRYNNADHSMLTAMTAVDLIIANSSNKAPIWSVNAEDDYHETK